MEEIGKHIANDSDGWARFREHRAWENGFTKGYWLAAALCIGGMILSNILFHA